MLVEYDRALNYTEALWSDLGDDDISWRPNEGASAIGWHLGHQPTVAHFMVRNLIAAEPRLASDLEYMSDSATPTSERGALPDADTLRLFRTTVANRVRARLFEVANGTVGAPAQLSIVAQTVLTAVINHEYQHSTWIGEVRSQQLDRRLPDAPTSKLVSLVDGYPIIDPFGQA